MSYSGIVWQITDVQRMDGEEMLNVYFYADPTSAGDADDLRLAFKDAFQLQLLDIQSVDLSHVALDVVNLFADGDFSTDSDVATGTIGTESFPHAVAVNFTLRPASRAVRPGSKRYAGVPESASNHNVINDSSYITQLNLVKDNLALEIAAPTDPVSSYIPVVVKRIPYTTPGGNPAYRLPTSGTEADVFEVLGALVNLTISHQVSRG
jgi:hypothetical protein